METLKPFELLQNLEPHSKASAVLLRWDGEKYVKSTEIIELHEVCATHGNKGDRGFCFLSPMSNHWESVSGLYQQVSSRRF